MSRRKATISATILMLMSRGTPAIGAIREKVRGRNGDRLYTADSFTPSSVGRVLDDDIECISDYITLKMRMERAANFASFQICPGRMVVSQAIQITANGTSLTCSGQPGDCILDKNGGPGRILNVMADGLSLVGIQFWNATSQGNGGAVHVQTKNGWNSVMIDSCTFSGNTANNSGGAVFVSWAGCNVLIRNSHFVNNLATVGNGGAATLLFGIDHGITCRIGCFGVHNNTFEGNRAPLGKGGGIHSNFRLCGFNSFNNNFAGQQCDTISRRTEERYIMCMYESQMP